MKRYIASFLIVIGMASLSQAFHVNPATSVVTYTKGPNNNTPVYNLDNSGT